MVIYNILKHNNKKFYCKKCGHTNFNKLKLENNNKLTSLNSLMVIINCEKCGFSNMIYHNKIKKTVKIKE